MTAPQRPRWHTPAPAGGSPARRRAASPPPPACRALPVTLSSACCPRPTPWAGPTPASGEAQRWVGAPHPPEVLAKQQPGQLFERPGLLRLLRSCRTARGKQTCLPTTPSPPWPAWLVAACLPAPSPQGQRRGRHLPLHAAGLLQCYQPLHLLPQLPALHLLLLLGGALLSSRQPPLPAEAHRCAAALPAPAPPPLAAAAQALSPAPQALAASSRPPLHA